MPLTEYEPHNQTIAKSPNTGIADNKFVITVAAQKLICPQGKT